MIIRYYCRLELQVRMNVFFCASITAGAVSGLLAYGIAHMDGVANYAGWRWIFILEGKTRAIHEPLQLLLNNN